MVHTLLKLSRFPELHAYLASEFSFFFIDNTNILKPFISPSNSNHPRAFRSPPP